PGRGSTLARPPLWFWRCSSRSSRRCRSHGPRVSIRGPSLRTSARPCASQPRRHSGSRFSWSCNSQYAYPPELRGVSLGALPRVYALRDLLDQLAVESRQVVGSAAGDEPLVDDDFLVDPVATRVADIGLEAGVRGQLAPFEDAGFDEYPWSMADRGDRLAFLEEALHEVDGVLIGSQPVGADGATGDDDGVVVGAGGIGEGELDVELAGAVIVTELRDRLARLGAEEHRFCPRLLDGSHGLGEFGVVGALVGNQERYLLTCQVMAHGEKVGRSAMRMMTLRWVQSDGPRTAARL